MSRKTEAAHKRRMEEDIAKLREREGTSLNEPMGGKTPDGYMDQASIEQAGDSYWSDYGD